MSRFDSGAEEVIADVMERLKGYAPCVMGPVASTDLTDDQIELHIIMSREWLDE